MDINTLLSGEPVLGYLDPGTGAIVLQAIVGGIAAALLFFRNSISRFFGFFKKAEPEDDEPEKPETADAVE